MARKPSEMLKVLIESEGLRIVEVAKALQVSRQQVYLLLRGESRFTPVMALRLEQSYGQSAEQVMWMQLQYDLAEARR